MPTTTELPSSCFFLQMSDSAFPTGAYAHSCGLEELARVGLVVNEAGLLKMLRHQIMPALAHFDLPLLRDAHRAAVADDFDEVLRVDLLAGVMRLPKELREASRRVGTRRLQTLLKLYSCPLLVRLQETVSKGATEGHHVTVYGCACRNFGIRETLESYFYQTVAGFCSASLKLLRIGQEGTQRVLSACLAEVSGVVDKALALPSEEIGWFDVSMDIASMRHEIANERLFIS